MDLKTMASLPFLKEASQYLKDHPDEFPGLDEVAKDVLYSGVREKAMRRINAALNRQAIPIDFLTEEECREEILAYIVARILVASTTDKHLIRWYSLAEAVRAQRILEESNLQLLLRVAKELGLNVSVVEGERGYGTENFKVDADKMLGIAVVDYLHLAVNLKSIEWKLINQPLRKGTVYLSKVRLARLIQEALKERFERELSEMKVPDAIRRLFSEQISELMGLTSRIKESYELRFTSNVVPERFPPCIKNLIGMTQAGKNVSHSGRFAMTAFLHRIGMNTEDIVEMFRVSPDFREDLARYQVEHITGTISGTEYESMSCKTMLTYGLCVSKDELCDKINHPLGYYEARNDDAFPEGERRLRRSLAAAYMIAKDMKLPIKNVQLTLQKWFNEVAVLDMLDNDLENLQDHFEKAADNSPFPFRVKVARAWLTVIKATHPGTMEDIYLVATMGSVEDAAGRVVKLMPVLDFENGRMIRDSAENKKHIIILGQFFSFRKRRYLNVIRATVED